MPLRRLPRPAALAHPERIAAVGEIDARLADRDIVAVLLHRPQEGHLDVEIVLAEGVVDQVLA